MPREPAHPSPLAVRIAALRKAADISQNALSLAVGGSHALVSHIEEGRTREPGVGFIVKIARALGTSVEFLVDGEGEAPTPEQTSAAFEAFEPPRSPKPATRAA
jgi:transcriptional regulator with XRE-family HTH domain